MPESFVDSGLTIEGGAQSSPDNGPAIFTPPTPANANLHLLHGVGDVALNIHGDSILIGSI